MKPTMLAWGPDFNATQVDTLQSIEIYPMVCSMLKLATCHGTDGTIDNSQEFVKSKCIYILHFENIAVDKFVNSWMLIRSDRKSVV